MLQDDGLLLGLIPTSKLEGGVFLCAVALRRGSRLQEGNWGYLFGLVSTKGNFRGRWFDTAVCDRSSF